MHAYVLLIHNLKEQRERKKEEEDLDCALRMGRGENKVAMDNGRCRESGAKGKAGQLCYVCEGTTSLGRHMQDSPWSLRRGDEGDGVVGAVSDARRPTDTVVFDFSMKCLQLFLDF